MPKVGGGIPRGGSRGGYYKRWRWEANNSFHLKNKTLRMKRGTAVKVDVGLGRDKPGGPRGGDGKPPTRFIAARDDIVQDHAEILSGPEKNPWRHEQQHERGGGLGGRKAPTPLKPRISNVEFGEKKEQGGQGTTGTSI